MIIPVDLGHGIVWLFNQITYHIGNWSLLVYIILSIVFVVGTFMCFLASTDAHNRVLRVGMILASCTSVILLVAVLVGVTLSDAANNDTIKNAYPAFKHSNIMVDFKDDQGKKYHGTLRVQKWNNKLANVDYTRPDRLVITPVNNVGKATINMAKYLKKHHVNKNFHMYIAKHRVTAKHEDFGAKIKYTINTDKPNKVIKRSTEK